MTKNFQLSLTNARRMKDGLYMLLTSILLFACSCSKNTYPGGPGDQPGEINQHYSKADTIRKMLKEYTAQGIPGVVVTVYSSTEKWWEAAEGFSKIETAAPMNSNHLQYLQSVSKTYLAVAVLKLWETGKINLDASITDYLSPYYASCITNANKISVRQLLNHTSGVAEYTDQPEYVGYLIEHPDHRFTSEELMGYIKGKNSQFEPGLKYQYTNTNYELLAFIVDQIKGDHAAFIYQTIIQPLHLSNTFYRYDVNYINYPRLCDSYLDRAGNGVIENISLMQRTNVSSMVGDDGIVCTPRDAVLFLRGLFEGKLLSAASMTQMMTWVKDGNGENIYGMGLYHVKYNGVVGYGHGGSGIGAACGLYYFPSKGITVFLGTNIGTIIYGPLVEKVGALKTKLLETVIK